MTTRQQRLKKLVAVQEQLKALHETRRATLLAEAHAAEAEAHALAQRFDEPNSLSGLFPDLYNRRIAGADDAARALGANGAVSTLGYVFHEKWAGEHPAAIRGFLAASHRAKERLKGSDAEWNRLHEAGVVKDEGKALETLRERYRDGIPDRPVAEEEADAARLFDVLAKLGGVKLVGRAKALPAGTYWQGLKDGG